MARAVARRGGPYANGLTAAAARDAAVAAGFTPVEALRAPDLVDRFAPPGGRIGRDGSRGVPTVDRIRPHAV